MTILGRHVEAWNHIDTANRCDPLSIPVAAFRSYVALQARRYELAVTAALEALELDPHAALTHDLLGRAYAKVGLHGEAIAAFDTALRLAGPSSLIEGYRGYAWARAGARHEAEQILQGLKKQGLTQYVSPVDVALVYVGLGDADAALAMLEEGYCSRAVRMMVANDPFFSELSPDPRYSALLARLRLPEFRES